MASYSEQVREEIFNSRPQKSKYYKTFCYGILLMGKRFDTDAVSLSTEHLTVSKLYGFAIRDCCGQKAELSVQKSARRAPLYTVTLTDKPAIQQLMEFLGHNEQSVHQELLEAEALPSFFAGAFLSCGAISEPDKAYHLEFLPPSGLLCDLLFELLCRAGYPPKCGNRREQTLLYFKDSTQIEDLLALMGAVNCSLSLMETKIYKDLRNRANRATNCETANIDKMLRAAATQLDDIALLEETGVLQTLSPQLISAADARRQNPDATLAELADLLGISRSGVNHRLTKLGQEAGKIRERQ